MRQNDHLHHLRVEQVVDQARDDQVHDDHREDVAIIYDVDVEIHDHHHQAVQAAIRLYHDVDEDIVKKYLYVEMVYLIYERAVMIDHLMD